MSFLLETALRGAVTDHEKRYVALVPKPVGGFQHVVQPLAEPDIYRIHDDKLAVEAMSRPKGILPLDGMNAGRIGPIREDGNAPRGNAGGDQNVAHVFAKDNDLVCPAIDRKEPTAEQTD